MTRYSDTYYQQQHSRYVARSAGFSLVELAIFMTVLALIMVAALSWLQPSARDEALKILYTEQRIREIQQALRHFRVMHGRLPCPASPTLTEVDAAYGSEDCTGIAHGGDDYNVGVVPFRSLGLSQEFRIDGWGRRFTYHVSRRYCDLDASGDPVNCTPTVYENGSGGGDFLVVRTAIPGLAAGFDPGNAANYTENDRVAYVIVSHGVNGDGAWMAGGAQRLSGRANSSCSFPGSCPEEYNIGNAARTAGDPDAPDRLYWSVKYSAEFDDFISFETQEQLDRVTQDFEQWVLTNAECTNADGTADDSIVEYINNYAAGDGTAILNDGIAGGAQAVLGVMWTMQDVCSRYYPESFLLNSDFACTPAAAAAFLSPQPFDRAPQIGINSDPALDGNRGYCL